jgi:hypothetical protein
MLAYIDPGSGSLLIQCLIAFLLGLLFAVRVFWRKLTVFFVRESKPMQKMCKPDKRLGKENSDDVP